MVYDSTGADLLFGSRLNIGVWSCNWLGGGYEGRVTVPASQVCNVVGSGTILIFLKPEYLIVIEMNM